jgi:hypothetical protein
MVNETIKALNLWSESLSKLNNASMRMMRRAVDDNIRFAGEMQNILSEMGIALPGASSGKLVQAKHPSNCQCGCCPPEYDCPPQCLLMLSRSAYPGETVIVPFSIRNTTGVARDYKVGVRDLLDQQGNIAPGQVSINKDVISLQPGQAVTLLAQVNLAQFQTGIYETDIVLREKDVNQNICFRLEVLPFPDAPEARPWDENKLLTHFQSWQSHFYCTPKKTGVSINPTVTHVKT